MNNEKDDKYLQQYLRGDSELSRRYQDGKLQQPAEYLDNMILNAARSSITKRKNRNWYLPVSIAAVMVIGVSLLYRVYDEQGPQVFSEPEMNGMMKNGSGPESLPAAPAAGTYRPTDSARNAPLQREIMETPLAGNHTIKQEQKSMEVQQPLGETMSVPGEREVLPQVGAESIIELQDKSFTGESNEMEKPAFDTILPAEPGVSSGNARQQEEQPAGSQGRAETAESSDVISVPFPAEKWLEEISTQWKAGKKEQAIAGLQRFLESYPEYPESELVKRLPEDFDLSGFMQSIQ